MHRQQLWEAGSQGDLGPASASATDVAPGPRDLPEGHSEGFGEVEYQQVMEQAGRFLARRGHSRHELAVKLTGPDEVVARVLDRLVELRLLDDAAFARTWIEERCRTRGREILIHELETKGVPREVALAAWGEVSPDEVSRARELASKHLRKVSRKPPLQQAAAIHAFLLRRGFPSEVAEDAARAVLPPDGWD